MNVKDVSPVTVVDVARRAGVSVGTVSRVLNGYKNVSAMNLGRVQEAMRELGYERSRPGEQSGGRRNGSRNHTGNIGLIFSEMRSSWADHPLVAAYSMGAERACQERGFHTLIEFCGDEESVPRCVREGKIDALLIKVTREMPAYVKELPGDLPVVCMGFNDPTVPFQQVAPDNRGAGWVVADYLWGKRHRRIGFVCADMMHPMFFARFQGFEALLRGRRGFDPGLCWLQESDHGMTNPEFSPPDLTAAVEKLLSAHGDPVTAIVAANDWMAQGLYAALAAAGKRVPDDISVVGFDNAVTICTSLRPSLTSYAIPFGDVSYAAALKVMERIQTPRALWDHSLHLVRGEIAERASVRNLPSTAP